MAARPSAINFDIGTLARRKNSAAQNVRLLRSHSGPGLDRSIVLQCDDF
jgi:hypothetical protein